MVCALQWSECLYAHHILSKRSWSVLLKYLDLILVLLTHPPIDYVSINTLWNVSKNVRFSNPPNQLLCN